MKDRSYLGVQQVLTQATFGSQEGGDCPVTLRRVQSQLSVTCPAHSDGKLEAEGEQGRRPACGAGAGAGQRGGLCEHWC